MTRLAVLADLHGNYPALEAIITDLAQWNIDQVIVAGDAVGLGPFGREVMERIAALGWAMLRGNHEYYLLDYNTPRCPSHWQTFVIPPLLLRQLDGHWRKVIAALPDTLGLRYADAPPVRVLHTFAQPQWEVFTPDTPAETILSKLDGVEETTIIYGHSHLIDDRQVGPVHIVNPGSAGLPLDGDHRASYMLLEGNATGWRATVRRVVYDVAPVLAEYERQDFIGQCGVFGYLVIQEFQEARSYYVPFLRWHAEHYPGQPQTVAHAQEFLRRDTANHSGVEK